MEEKREGEKKKKRKRKRRRREAKQKGMDFYDFWYGFYMESKDLMVLYGILGNFMSFKPRVLIGFHPNPNILESKWVKPQMVQEKHGILPLRLDSWFN